MRPLACALFLLAAGCGSAPVWTHPTKDSSEYKKDLADCERFFSASERETLGCMTRRGWRREN
jgi:hypothetical protein